MYSYSPASACPTCAHALPKAAARCVGCGFFLADVRLSQFQSDGKVQRPVCRDCGIALPRAAARCLSCSRPQTADRQAGAAGLHPANGIGALPRLHVTTTDNRRLENIGRLHFALGHPVARFLIQELERAVLCRPDAIPDHVVTLGSRVLFRLEPVGVSAVRQLVAPHRHRLEGKQVSILSPLGAALIGLSEGDSMPYTNLAGAARVVTVETIAGRPQAQIASAP